MAKKFNPLAKLRPYQSQVVLQMISRLKRAKKDIQGQIALASANAKMATSAKERESLLADIERRFGEIARGIDAQLRELTAKVGETAHEAAIGAIGGKARIVRYDPARNERYFRMVHPSNEKNIAAVFTEKTSGDLVHKLRSTFVDVFRQGTVEGMTANEMQKALRDRWGAVANDNSNFKFVDRSGRRWEDARYLQMLVRTNAQRVARESSIDTFAENGMILMQISDDGDADCPVCAAWEGRIIQTAGQSRKYPTYEDALAAGVFHPNCTHRLDPVDEEIDKDEIKRQGEIGKPDKDEIDDPEFMQAQKDELDEGRHIDRGLSREDARRAVTMDRLEAAIRGGVFSDEAAKAARMLSAADLDRIRAGGIPMFEQARKGELAGETRYGRILTPREPTAQDMLKLLGVAGDGDGKAAERKTETQAKQATSPLLSAINSVRPDIANKKHEVFVVFDQNGKEVFERHNSGPQGGRLPDEWNGKLAGKTIIHNHPVEPRHKGFGISFSLDDIQTSSSLNLANIVMVSPRRDYIMEPGDPEKGWPNVNVVSESYDKHKQKVETQLVHRYRSKRISGEGVELLYHHLIWKRVVKETGMRYSVTRHKDE